MLLRGDVFIFLLVTLCHSANAGKLVQISDTGSFTVLIDNEQWFSSSSVFFRSAGKLYSTSDASLLYVGQHTSRGQDQLGSYEQHALEWHTACGQYSFFGNILEYDSAIVFEQVFPSTLTNTSSGDADSVISSFPSFELGNSDNKQDTGFAQWVSWYYTDDDEQQQQRQQQHQQVEQHRRALVAPGFDSPLLGRWNDVSANISDGMGGSGVMCIFGAGTATRAVVLAPLDNFMAASHEFDPGIIWHNGECYHRTG